MTPKLIEQYIFKRALFATIIATVSLTGVVWVVKAFQGVDLITSKGQSILLYLYMTTLGVPTLISVILPVAMLLGVMNCINGMNNDSELVVINASGASQGIILRPLLALGFLTAAVVMAIALYYGPSSLAQLRLFVTQVRSDLVSVIIKEGEFSKIGNNLTFHIAERGNGGLLKGVFVQDERSKKETFTYIATEGSIVKKDGKAYMLLRDGEIQRSSRKSSNISIIKFDSYAFDLSSLSGSKFSGTSLEETPTMGLLYPDKNSSNYKKRPGALIAEFHNRVTSGFYPFAFILIVMAISGQARSTRQGYEVAITTAFFLCIALRGGSIVAINGSRSDPDLISMIYILPIVGILIPSIYLFMEKQMGLPKFAQNWLDHLQYSVENIYTRWANWYIQWRRRRTEVSS